MNNETMPELPEINHNTDIPTRVNGHGPLPPPIQPFFPIWATIPLYVIACVIIMSAAGTIVYLPKMLFPGVLALDSFYLSVYAQIMISALTAAGAWFVALIFLKYLDIRPASDLGMNPKGRGKDCLIAFIFAAVLYAIGFGVSVMTGDVMIESIQFNPYPLITSFIHFFFAAAFEEIMMRGYILSRLMSRMNKFAALAISSVIFSLLHIFNPNLGILPIVNLFLAGLLLGAAFIYTRNI